ncbi:hypothetical protein EDB81DRAFT_778915 [Dactylonectria macrodidyma]|uniref:Secreted protein n=1 Tax=Dactylonectria macrodidyma TaxID=307937 RepID=A0A9P9JER7_9HYPO|nr:hypothetical protein EDB81DRAFT_778915 [Dactylonectria macrodidyma]
MGGGRCAGLNGGISPSSMALLFLSFLFPDYLSVQSWHQFIRCDGYITHLEPPPLYGFNWHSPHSFARRSFTPNPHATLPPYSRFLGI